MANHVETTKTERRQAVRQMKDSGIVWIEDVPQEWEVRIAKTIFIRMYRPVRKEDEVITCFRDGEVTLRKNRRTDGFTESLKEIGYQGIRKGDLVIHQMDAFAGSIGISDSDGKGSPVYICLRPQNEDECLNKFYVYLLRQMAECGYIKSLYRGIRERSSDFRFETFATLSLPIPPLSEQRAIADYLDVKCGEVDALVSLQEEMISELQAYKQSVITEAVTHGLNPNAKLVPSGIDWIGDVPEHWEKRHIKNVAKIYGRIGFRDYTTEDLVDEGEGAITLSPSNMRDGKMIYGKCSYLSWPKYYESPEIMINNGDILMVKTGSTYGKVSLVDNLPMEATINPQIIVFKQIECNKVYLAYLLMTNVIQDQIQFSVGGSTIPTLSQNNISNYTMCIPPLFEQQQIAAYLDKKCADIDALIELKQQKIEELKVWKKSLIFECVTGKREIV